MMETLPIGDEIYIYNDRDKGHKYDVRLFLYNDRDEKQK